MSEATEKSSNKLEIFCGLFLAVFAAILAIADLGGGKYGDEEMQAVIEKSNAQMWYQSKSIKQSLAEGNEKLLSSLVKSGTIATEKRSSIDSVISELGQDIVRYGKEKNEILKGSKIVGKENWVQDIDGEFGKVTGVKDWEKTQERLGNAGDYFDMATLFLQLCLVMGAICLISTAGKSKKIFFLTMLGLGAVGACFTAFAYMAVG